MLASVMLSFVVFGCAAAAPAENPKTAPTLTPQPTEKQRAPIRPPSLWKTEPTLTPTPTPQPTKKPTPTVAPKESIAERREELAEQIIPTLEYARFLSNWSASPILDTGPCSNIRGSARSVARDMNTLLDDVLRGHRLRHTVIEPDGSRVSPTPVPLTPEGVLDSLRETHARLDLLHRLGDKRGCFDGQ